MIEKFREYYKNNLLLLPPDPQWRQFKLRLFNNKFFKLKNQIRDAFQLRKYLVKFVPRDIWVSVSTWFVPTHQTGKRPKNRIGETWKWNNLRIYYSDFVVDIDHENQRTALENAQKIAEIMEIEGFEDQVYVRTKRGFQIWFLRAHEIPKRIEKPHERVNWVRQHKIKLARFLKNKGFEFDYPTTCDVFRIVRVWNSLHNSGQICYLIGDIHDFMLPFSQESREAMSEPSPIRMKARGKEVLIAPTLLAAPAPDIHPQSVLAENTWSPHQSCSLTCAHSPPARVGNSTGMLAREPPPLQILVERATRPTTTSHLTRASTEIGDTAWLGEE